MKMKLMILAAFVAAASSLRADSEIARAEFAKYWNLIAEGPQPKLVFRTDRSLAETDAYRVREEGGALVITGVNDRSCLYGVYDFFERKGCAWFWDGDRLPPKGRVSVKGTDFFSKARFEYRGLRYFAHRSLTRFQAEHWDFADWKKEIDWACKRRLDLMMLRIGMDDLFSRAFPDVVPYPTDYKVDYAMPRSYNDRTLFWDMKTRSEIRRQVMDYARERGFMIPEDTGTMSHWYSRTPTSFLDKMKPDFVPQANKNYNQRSGLVWDIRQDKWLDAYWKLTQASIDTYGGGTPQLFHTIGLGERTCFADRERNHAFKLMTYDRIISKLREHYPETPLLVASWDFISTWSPKEVRELVAKLDPKRTLILDYTSDIWDNDDNFLNWDLIGNFPWIYGIFHAYEASNEIRGNYGNIRQRFPKAAKDPMCKGVVFWPENSHADTLMLDFFSAIAWDASNAEIDDHLVGFCRRRYGADRAAKALALWRRFLPLAEASRWGTQVGNGYSYNPNREMYPDAYFNLHGWFYGDEFKYMVMREEYFVFLEALLGKHEKTANEILDELERVDLAAQDEFTRRDMIDIRRTIVARLIELHLARIGLNARRYFDGGDPQPLLNELNAVRALGRRFTATLALSPEFSLNAALADLKRKHPTNPDFEKTLKGNAAVDYCRSHIYELAKYVYEPTFEAFAKWVEARVKAGDRRPWTDTAEEQERLFKPVLEAFYAKPLAEMQP